MSALKKKNLSLIQKLLTSAFGKGAPDAQMTALFFGRYFAITSLAQKLQAQGKLDARILNLQKEFVQALSTYLTGLATQVQKAIKTGDAHFFHDFATALEEQFRNRKGRDATRAWLLMEKLEGNPPKTINEIEKLLKEFIGIDPNESNRRQLYRICKEVGYRIAKGQEGRPKKLRQAGTTLS